MLEENSKKNIIIYNTIDGKASVSLYAKDGMIWMNQSQLAELFDTSKQNIGQHISSILKDNELNEDSVVKNYFTTAADGKEYKSIWAKLSHFEQEIRFINVDKTHFRTLFPFQLFFWAILSGTLLHQNSLRYARLLRERN